MVVVNTGTVLFPYFFNWSIQYLVVSFTFLWSTISRKLETQ